MSTPRHQRFQRLASALVLPSCVWAERLVQTPLGVVVHADEDEVLLELSDGTRLVIAQVTSLNALRVSLRRWCDPAKEHEVQVLAIADDDVAADIIADEPKRPGPGLRLAFTEQLTALWDDGYPPFMKIVEHLYERQAPTTASWLQTLQNQEGRELNSSLAVQPSELFGRVVFALAQAHDLVRLVGGSARLHLRTGGAVVVCQWTNDVEQAEQNLAAILARCFADEVRDSDSIGLICVHGPHDIKDRARELFGPRADVGLLSTIDDTGGVWPSDHKLAELIHQSREYDGNMELWDCLDAGLARSRGTTIAKSADHAGAQRISLIRGLLDDLQGSKLTWFDERGARLEHKGRDLMIAWVEIASVTDAVQRWKLAALAAKWTGRTVDLLLEGGDVATWQRARRELPAVPDGHIFHMDKHGRVRSQAGVFGWLAAPAKAMRAVGRLSGEDRECTTSDLRARIERDAMAEYRVTYADIGFRRRLAAYKPWATRASIVLCVLVYALQLRWNGTSGSGMVAMGSLTGEGLLAGEPWRWVSSAFLHGFWWHLGLNMLALAVLGKRIEALLGPSRFLLVFIASCVGGAVLHELMSVPGDLALGSSAGILGLLGAQGGIVLFQQRIVPKPARRLLWKEVWLNGLIIGGLSLLPFVAGMAHLGGAITGFALTATGLACLGVQPARSEHDNGPTRRSEPRWLQGIAGVATALAIGSVANAWVTGQPWRYTGGPGVVDVQTADARVTLPLPRGLQPTHTLVDGVVHVTAGDVLRDGIHLELKAWRVGDLTLTQTRTLAWPDATGVRSYVTGGHATLQQERNQPITSYVDLFNRSERYRRIRFLQVHDGVAVQLDMVALHDSDGALLGGTWRRLPGGLAVEPSAFDDLPINAAAYALSAMLQASPPDVSTLAELDAGLFQAVYLVQSAQPSTDALDKHLQGVVGRQLALRLADTLSLDGQHDTAKVLGDRALSHAAGANDQLAVRLAVIGLAEKRRDYDTALQELNSTGLDTPFMMLYRAQIHSQLGDVPAAKADALAYLNADSAENWLSWALDAPPGMQGNEGWANYLAGDLDGCIESSDAAVDGDPDLSFAIYNGALCSLAAGHEADAISRYNRAHELAHAQHDAHAKEASKRDLEVLVRANVTGAQSVYDQVFGDK
ncbi:MAG: membrane associated rhomboid family serine protease/tetratricopeptide (TPR) repeat protein [Kiritimatiellia bacterium]|jgi:membrane associated rhomboid family serine protease/tetratricopeptide (TPR) repeat protein